MGEREAGGQKGIRLDSRVQALLDPLRTTVSEVEAAAVILSSGVVVGAFQLEAFDESPPGATVVGLRRLAATGYVGLKLGQWEELILTRRRSQLIFVRVGDDAMLLARADQRAAVGLLLRQLKALASRLEPLLSPALQRK
jgi:predicted regulator of Ras-like GTPase activity (Roadblock/LC7/MglB family)